MEVLVKIVNEENDVPKVKKIDKDARGLLVKDVEVLAGTPDFSSRNKKENSMETKVKNKKKEYKGYTIESENAHGDYWFTIYKGSKEVFSSGPSYNTTADALSEGESKIDELLKRKKNSDPYKFNYVTAADKINKGKHIYGSKIDNSVCECPECYGGGRLGLFACRNCKGTGKVGTYTM